MATKSPATKPKPKSIHVDDFIVLHNEGTGHEHYFRKTAIWRWCASDNSPGHTRIWFYGGGTEVMNEHVSEVTKEMIR